MNRNRIQTGGMMIITLITLALVMVGGRDKIDCQAPETWATASGVHHCAINGGK